MNELDDEQLCALSILACGAGFRERLASGAFEGLGAAALASRGDWSEDFGAASGITRADWRAAVDMACDTSLSKLVACELGDGLDEGSICLWGPTNSGDEFVTYVVFADDGSQVGEADAQVAASYLDYASYGFGRGPVVTGRGSGGAKAIAGLLAGTVWTSRCVVFGVRGIDAGLLRSHENALAWQGGFVSVHGSSEPAGLDTPKPLRELAYPDASGDRRTRASGGGAYGRGGSGVHDFSDAARDAILAILAEIEAEPWYDVSRWDLWYRLERAAGHLTLENYQDDIRSYQRKTLDIAGTSAQEVRLRFARADELDRGCARHLEAIGGKLAEAAARLDSIGF